MSLREINKSLATKPCLAKIEKGMIPYFLRSLIILLIDKILNFLL